MSRTNQGYQKGDILDANATAIYKNSYHWNNTDINIHTTFAGGKAARGSLCGLLFLNASDGASATWYDCGFAKVTILDN